MVKVLKSGFYATIQDRGRFGQRSFGVPISGAMDLYSSEFANALVGNDKGAAVLEMTMTGAELQFLNPTIIAITGANMTAKLNKQPIDMFKSIKVNVNDILSFGRLESGFRTYIAVKGGFLNQKVLGSVSMTKSITKKVKIKNGDTFEINSFSDDIVSKNAKLKFNTSIINENTLEVFKGPEFKKLSKTQQQLLFTQDFEVSKHNNRMAYQLLPLFQNNLEPILTAPVLPGTIQLTPSGQLIVLMRDCQTTGGYPRVLQLAQKSINIMSQKSTGNAIRLRLRDL